MITAFLVMVTLMSKASAAESNLRLELESSVRSLRLGQSTKLKIKVIGSGVYEITEKTEGIEADNMRAGAFVYEFEFKPQRLGTFSFGPYALSMNGQKMNSNRVTINVLPQWDGTYGTFFRVDTNSIVLGENIELVAETWSKIYDRNFISLDRKETFVTQQGRSNISSRHSGNGGTVVYNCNSWFITPKQAGEFKISRDIFRRLPEDIKPPDFIIMVKKPAQQSPETDK